MSNPWRTSQSVAIYWSFPTKSSTFGSRVRNHVVSKAPGVALGLANARPPELTMCANAPQLPDALVLIYPGLLEPETLNVDSFICKTIETISYHWTTTIYPGMSCAIQCTRVTFQDIYLKIFHHSPVFEAVWTVFEKENVFEDRLQSRTCLHTSVLIFAIICQWTLFT